MKDTPEHDWVFELEYGVFLCSRCLAEKDSDFAALGCMSDAQAEDRRARRAALDANIDAATVALAIKGLVPCKVERRLWPALREALERIYHQSTGEKRTLTAPQSRT